MADGMNDLFNALNIFQGGVQQLQQQRTINAAGDAVQQIRASEASDNDKLNQLRGVSEQLAFHLASQGSSASEIQNLNKYVPEQYKPQNAEQALLFGTPEQQETAKTVFGLKQNNALDLLQAKQEGLLAGIQARADAKADTNANQEDNKLQMRADSAVKFMQPDASVRSGLGSAVLVKQNAERLKGLIGSDTSPEVLDKLAPQFVNEAAQGVARMVKGGVASEGEVRQFIPSNVQLDAASMANYLTSGPGAANQGKFVQLYAKAAQREAAVADQQIEGSVLQRAQGRVDLFENPKTADKMKNFVSSLIPGSSGSDFTVEDGKLRYAPSLQREKTFNSILGGLKEATLQSKSADPATKAKGQQVLKTFGYSPDQSINQIKSDLDYRVKSGEFE